MIAHPRQSCKANPQATVCLEAVRAPFAPAGLTTLLTSHGRLLQYRAGNNIGREDNPMRGYHDIGGDPAGPVPKEQLPWLHWEKQVEAIRSILGDATRRMVSLDEMRHGFESFGADKYRSLSFYGRRLESMLDILERKGMVTRAEVAKRAAEIKARRAQDSKAG